MVFVLIYLAFCIVAAFIGNSKKITGVGAFFLSLFLSPIIGIIVALVSEESDNHKLEKLADTERILNKYKQIKNN